MTLLFFPGVSYNILAPFIHPPWLGREQKFGFSTCLPVGTMMLVNRLRSFLAPARSPDVGPPLSSRDDPRRRVANCDSVFLPLFPPKCDFTSLRMQAFLPAGYRASMWTSRPSCASRMPRPSRTSPPSEGACGTAST